MSKYPEQPPTPTHPHSPSIPFLLLIYLALMILLTLTVFAAHFPLGPVALLIALAIAAAKSILVILYFMHIRFSSRVTWLFVTAGFLWLLILFSLTFAEYAGRTTLQRAQPLPQQTASQLNSSSRIPVISPSLLFGEKVAVR